MIYQKPKGTKDIYGIESRRVEAINSAARLFFSQNGYSEIKTPTFEFTELFCRSIGTTTDIVEKEIYTFEIDDRSYALRPEGTASVLRAFIENKLPRPARFLYLGSMFRKERPQKGRYREFLQIGIELLGEGEPFYDAEIIDQGKRFLDLIGAKDAFIEINSIGCLKCRALYKNKLRDYLQPKIDKICADCRVRFERNFLRVFDCKNESCQIIYDEAPKITDNLCPECATHYVKVKDFLTKFKIDYAENKKLVRGLDYYTRTVFEFKHKSLGAQDTIIAGGRYDLLMNELGGGDVPCTGWAMGVERLLLALPQNLPKIEESKTIFIAVMGERFVSEILKIRKIVHDHGLSCILGNPADSIKSQMKNANRVKADYVVIYGEDEATQGVYTLKNMKSGEQKKVSLTELPQSLKT